MDDLIPTPAVIKDLQKRYVALQVRLSTLNGQAAELSRQKTDLGRSIGLAKARLELAPQAAEVFEYLQEKAHARAVGEFEDLLSAFVQDVAPQAGEVRLVLGTERSAPSLDIYIDNGGDLEGVLEGNGGGLTNLVVTGLAFSALSRTQNRQLIVLDEPDCWLKSSYVPALTKVIAQVANPQEDESGRVSQGCQTLMISHNDIAYMDEGAHIQELRLESDLRVYADRSGLKVVEEGDPADCAYVVWASGGGKNGTLRVIYRHDSEADLDNNALTKGYPVVESISGAKAFASEQTGIRWIEVRNLRHHVFTRLELSAGLNVLAGDINSGKSTLYLTALRALAYGETDDTMIRHGADEACVRVGLEDGVELEVVRKRKGSPRVLFRRYQDGVKVHEARPESRNSVPDFITDVLKISPVDDLDIQLRSQKQPVFLLNETPAKRARLLSVGKEAGLLQSLIERHRLAVRRDREQVKREEIQFSQVSRMLKALSPLSSLAGLIPLMEGALSQAREGTEQAQELTKVLSGIRAVVPTVRLSSWFDVQAQVVPASPRLVECARLVEVVGHLRGVQNLARMPIPAQNLKMPDIDALVAAQKLAVLLEGLKTYRSRLLVEKALHLLPTEPVVHDIKGLQEGISVLSKILSSAKALKVEQADLDEQVAQAVVALEQCKAQIGVCPVCDKPFGESHSHQDNVSCMEVTHHEPELMTA